MKSEQNQGIDSFGVLSVFLVIGLCLMVSAPAWNGSRSEDFEKTMRRAENLAYQIIEAHDALEIGIRTELNQGRHPASESSLGRLNADAGEIGKDHWGHPFHFRVIRKNQRQTLVFVWSLGPNGKAETFEDEFVSSRDIAAFEFAGDDVGTIVIIK